MFPTNSLAIFSLITRSVLQILIQRFSQRHFLFIELYRSFIYITYDTYVYNPFLIHSLLLDVKSSSVFFSRDITRLIY